MTLRPRILTERLARVFRALYPLEGWLMGSKLLHQHRANVRATVSLPPRNIADSIFIEKYQAPLNGNPKITETKCF